MDVNNRVDSSIGISLTRTFALNKKNGPRYQYALSFPDYLANDFGKLLFDVFNKNKFKNIDFKNLTYMTCNVNKFKKLVDFACQKEIFLPDERAQINREILGLPPAVVSEEDEIAKAIAASLQDFEKQKVEQEAKERQEREDFDFALAFSLQDQPESSEEDQKSKVAQAALLKSRKVAEPVLNPQEIEPRPVKVVNIKPAPRALPQIPQQKQQAPIILPPMPQVVVNNDDSQVVALPPPPVVPHAQLNAGVALNKTNAGVALNKMKPLNPELPLSKLPLKRPTQQEPSIENKASLNVAPQAQEPMKKGSPPPPPPVPLMKKEKPAIKLPASSTKAGLGKPQVREGNPSMLDSLLKSYQNINNFEKPVEQNVAEDAWKDEKEIPVTMPMPQADGGQVNRRQPPLEKVNAEPTNQNPIPKEALNDLQDALKAQRNAVSSESSEDSWED